MIYCDKYYDELRRALDSVNIDRLKGKKVLITGGGGLIMSAVTDIICYANDNSNASIEIYMAARNESKIKKRFCIYSDKHWFHYVYYDAVEPIRFDFDVDFIIHGASNAYPAAYVSEPAETIKANTFGMAELLDYAVRVNKCRVLYISSSEVYGKNIDAPYKENDYGYVDILDPRACYPIGKRAAETMCAAYHAEYGIDTVIVRPGHIYGPTITDTDDRATAQFTRDVLVGRNILMKSAGSQLRSYCYCMDCATAIITVLLKGVSGEAYNISNRDSVVSIRDAAEAFAIAGKTDLIFAEASDTEKKGYNLMDNSSLDSEKIEALGWKAVYSISEGVKNTIEIMRQMQD